MPKVQKQKEKNPKPYDSLDDSTEEEYIKITGDNIIKMAQPETPTLPASELIKEAARIREFRGDGEYDLISFIREVDLILPLFEGNAALQQFVLQRYVINKIQGEALKAIRTLGNSTTWTTIKQELIKSFGVKDTYYGLHQKAMSTRNYLNVSDYFHKLKNILDDLNTKYEFDVQKPKEFSPLANENAILNIFLNGIDPSLSCIIHSRKISNLREAYYTLEQTNMLRHFYKKPYNKNFKKTPHQNSNETDTNQNTYQNKQPQPPNQQNYQVNPNQKYPNNFYHNRREYSTQSRQYSNRTRQSNFNRNIPEPMDVDHIQTDNDEKDRNIEENFQSVKPQRIYR